MREVKERFSPLPLIMVGFGLLLMGAALYFMVRTPQKTTSAPAISTGAAAPQEIPYPDVRRTSLADAKRAFDEKSAAFVDARGDPYYSEGHIPGAIAISPLEIEQKLPALDPQIWIITYCL